MVVEAGSPKFGGRSVGSIFHPPNGEGKDYKWYDIPANWGMDYATDPTELRGTSSTTIDLSQLPSLKLTAFRLAHENGWLEYFLVSF